MSGYTPRPDRRDTDPNHPLNRPVQNPKLRRMVRSFRPTGDGYVKERRWFSAEHELPPILWTKNMIPNGPTLSAPERAMFQTAYWFEFGVQVEWMKRGS